MSAMAAVPLYFTKLDGPAGGGELPLLMAHGLLGQGRNFGTLAKALAAARDVYVVDMRNHGDSPWDARMDYPAMAEDLANFIATEMGGQAHVFGHSMGGKAAMRLALDAPERVAGLMVADIAPVAYTHSHLSEINALRALDLSTITRRSEADTALRDAVPDRGMRAFLVQNLRLSPEGTRYRSNLDVLADAMETLVGWAEVRGESFTGPVRFIAGGESSYVKPAHHAAIHTLFPRATIDVIPGAGHWIHAQKPQEVRASVQDFLAGL